MRPGQAALAGPSLRERFDAPLPRAFYARPTITVARDLLGRWLAVRDGRRIRAARIVETEAYVAGDPANHAARGPTPRNGSMFAGPGTLYVYRIHQVHCANAVTRRGQAVLLRAAEALTEDLASLSGPGRLCRALEIGSADDGSSLVEGRIRILPGGPPPPAILTTPRIGLSQAVDRPLRFIWRGHAAVSGPRRSVVL